MKELSSKGLGSEKKQADPITYEEENCLWEKSILGTANPQQILQTLVFLIGKMLFYSRRRGTPFVKARTIYYHPSD
jgi:hypothetical protein